MDLLKYFDVSSFSSGIGKLLDLGNTSSINIPEVHISSEYPLCSIGSIQKLKKDSISTDIIAIESDWKIVGNDLQNAIKKFSQQQKGETINIG